MKKIFTIAACAVMLMGAAVESNAAVVMVENSGKATHTWAEGWGNKSLPGAELSKTETNGLLTIYDPEGFQVSGRSGILFKTVDEKTWYKHWEPATLNPDNYVDYYSGDGNNTDVFFEGNGTFFCVNSHWNQHGCRANVQGRPTCVLSVNGEETEMPYNEETGCYEIASIQMEEGTEYNVRLKTEYLSFAAEKRETGYLFSYTAAESAAMEAGQEVKAMNVNIRNEKAAFTMRSSEYSFAFNPVASELTIVDLKTSGVEGVEGDGVEVVGGNGYISVKGADSYKIYNVSGMQIQAAGTQTEVPAGIYMVLVGKKTVKVVVK